MAVRTIINRSSRFLKVAVKISMSTKNNAGDTAVLQWGHTGDIVVLHWWGVRDTGGYDAVGASLRLMGLIELERPSRSTLYLPLLTIHRKIVPARPLSSAALTSPCTTTLVPVT